ncbi:hypothetical protein M0D21_18290 [Aquimarina sp. D1M17]|nr:hypothetical protein [Aquimarina acroporae]MCK8523539.1 hypothetical protein [Aquimarina acroporae]
MRTIKTFFAILFFGALFIGCETDTVDEEIGLENIEVIGEDGDEEVNPK